MRFGLTDEQRRIVATVREVTQREFKPRGLRYMSGEFPWDNIRPARAARNSSYGSLGGGTSETLRDLIAKRLMESDLDDGILGISDL